MTRGTSPKTDSPVTVREDAPAQRVCLNCGATLHPGNYCHMCGQPADTGRLTAANLGVTVLSGLTRINRKFLFTIRNLLTRPWRVVSDYIGGRRSAYTAPVQLLIVLVFIQVAVASMFGQESSLASVYGNTRFIEAPGAVFTAINAVVRFLITSVTFLYIIVLIPAVPLVRFFHRRLGIRRYNLAEYVVAALYMSCFILAATMLLNLPLRVFDYLCPGKTFVGTLIIFLVVMTVFVRALYKSFASSSKKRFAKVTAIVLFLVVTVVFYLCLFVLFFMIHELSKGHGL